VQATLLCQPRRRVVGAVIHRDPAAYVLIEGNTAG